MEIVRTEETPAEAPPETPPEEPARQRDEGKARRLRLWLAAAAAAALALALGLALLPSPGRRSGYTVEWFQQEAADVPDQAFVRIYTKAALPVAIKQQTAESTPVWEYNLFIREENGVGVTVSELTCVRFYKSGKTDIYATTVDVFGERNGGRPSYTGGRCGGSAADARRTGRASAKAGCSAARTITAIPSVLRPIFRLSDTGIEQKAGA